uniref:E3 ubiquitin-protein ligase listerin n=1 Tax=Esox lucius TaxID=8010 RepID=A0A6Q2YC32_ESOLU
MGKNKQRTKGNVRPSSSGRAAELLARESGAVPGFVGFGNMATTELGYVPAVHGAEEIDNLVDADFRLVLRKLSKRDTVTKLKAAQEFGAMCQQRDSDVVKGVLPYWPRIYCKMSVDHDRRVREATQQAFEQLVLKVRRSLAPYLKSLMGHWLLSQCDTYAPASSAACQAFSAAFPPSKQAEALSFCKDEVLTVLQDNLLKETADTLSDPQSVPEEEREAKFLRLLTSSLLGVKRLISSLPQTETHSLQDRLTHLLSQAKFWKYSKHQTPQVRGAFFELMSSLCEHSPVVVQAEAARVCPTVLLALDDTDPMVLPPLWEAVLHTLSTVTDCWSHVNAKKGVLPKLWSLLRDGGKGMATSLHPNLLPFISKLPSEVTAPDLDFYTTFYSSLIQGLSRERAISSPSESSAIVVSSVECLRYTLLQNTGEEEEHRLIRTMIIQQQLLPLIDSALGNSSLQAGPLFPLVTEMLLSWEKRAGLQNLGGLSEGENEVVFDRLLSDFWEGLRVMLARHVSNEELELNELEGMASLLQVGLVFLLFRSVKICFSEPESSVSPEEVAVTLKHPQPEPPELGQGSTEGVLRSWHLEEIVCQQAQISYSYVDEKNSERHLVYLSLLLQTFHTPRVFTVKEKLKAKDDQKEVEGVFPTNPAVHFLLEHVVLWLSQEDRMETSYLVEMVFSCLRCCGRQETTRILNHITTVMDLKWAVLLQIIHKACADAASLQACSDWLKGSVLGERLLGLAEELCEAGLKGSGTAPDKDSWALISLALSQYHNNEPLIGAVYVEKMIEKLHGTLSAAKGLSEEGDLEPLVCFICDVASTFFSSVTHCLLLPSAEELLLTVFTLTAQDRTLTHMSGNDHTHLCRVMTTHTHLYNNDQTHTHTDTPVSGNDHTHLYNNDLTHTHTQIHTHLLFPLSESRLSTLQVLCPCLTPEERERLIALATAGILNWQEDNSKNTQTHAILLLCCLEVGSPVDEELLHAVLATMMEWRNSKEDWFLFSSDLSKTSTTQLSLSVEMMRFLSWLVTHSSKIITGSHWDFLLCSMLAWLETASDNVECLWNPWVQLFVCECCELIVRLNQFFTAPPPGVADLMPSELTAEWNDFFVEGIYSLMLPLPGRITDDPLFPLAVLRSVGVALTYVPLHHLSHNSLPVRFVADQKTNLPEKLQTLLNTLSPLLLFKARPLQLTVYHILDKVMPTLPECDGEGDNTKSDDDREEPCLSPPAALMSVLSTCEELCETILSGLCVGEFAVVVPLSVEYSCILAYLLAWKLLLSFFRAAPSHLRVQYSLYLKKNKTLHKLLLHLFRLMPENPTYPGQGAESAAKETKTFFTESLSLDIDSGYQHTLHHLACSVYYSTVQDLPAMVRLWWTSQEKRVSHAVDKFTGRYVSSVLSAQEICSVHASTQTFDSMTVKARSAAREVIATYSVDDIFIELVIQLPQNYPLGSIVVESGRRVGVAVQQWRNWMLQLSTYLTHQNGSIMEGLALWKTNVDKRFEGVEDCTICFSVIHGSNYSLPKKACRTCKKKFHSACLYKWFTSSNKSTCPLCRETFF